MSGVFFFFDVIGVIGGIGAISSNRTLEYAEEFFHIDVLVAVLTFYLKNVDDFNQFEFVK